MLTPVSTLLARAHRHRQLLLFCTVTSLETLEACVAAAEAEGRSLVLIVPVTTPTTSSKTLVASAHWLAEHSKVVFGLQISCTSGSLDEARMVVHYFSDFSQLSFACSYLEADLNLPSGWERSAYLDERPDTTAAEKLVRTGRINSVHLHIPTSGRRIGNDALAYIEKSRQFLKVPLVGMENDLSAIALGHCMKAGMSGLVLHNHLNTAFTAGLRTALRSRELNSPEVYLGKGRHAVMHCVHTYLTLT